ncbi:hypothetical protein [Streptomyces sp. MJP52]|uniref:hypothetical protein n=1 Tax=Streptomyces sp. MJP52 TaxID=2940555 RepID=UPI002474ED81|nr:hypothetical protein [Streptomyces sp. MJP52]MDH6224255.1 hypothetical protein [Streptomyces sp. MJP52]
MTQTPVPVPAVAAGPGPARRLLRATAVVACLPYLGLKAAWIAGSRIGIPDGSALLDHRVTMAVANGLSMLLDSGVIVLALVLTRPWGRRAPAWVLVLPAWVATGLLAPIMAGFPLQLVARAFAGGVATGADARREPFLHEWVFGVVYAGFIVQGLALGALFVLHARERWGHLWRGRMGDLPAGVVDRGRRAVAVAAAVLALFPAAVRLLWACGGTAGLGAGRAAERTSDFHVLEGLYVAFLVAAVTGTLLLAFRRGRVLPVAVPVALTWVCSGAVACWGGWMLLGTLATAGNPADRPTDLVLLTYAAQMIVGLLLASVGVHFLARRPAAARVRP